jgi:hypothetical protein
MYLIDFGVLIVEIVRAVTKKVFQKRFFLIRIVGGGVQAGSTRHVGH